MKRIISLIIVLLVSGNIVFAGNDKEPSASVITTTLEGKVTDLLTSEELAGVTVQIEGTGMKAYTDIEGNFKIENVEPGNYNLTVSYISYKELKIQDITTTSRVDIELEQIK